MSYMYGDRRAQEQKNHSGITAAAVVMSVSPVLSWAMKLKNDE